jgi:hypothetical protein
MTVALVAILFLPFSAWYAHRAWRAVKTGAADTLGDPVYRTSRPAMFWFLVVVRLTLGLWSATIVLSTLGWLRPANAIWLGAGCLVASTAIALAAAGRPRGEIGSGPENRSPRDP